MSAYHDSTYPVTCCWEKMSSPLKNVLRERNVQSFVSIQFYCKNVTLPNMQRYVGHQRICHLWWFQYSTVAGGVKGEIFGGVFRWLMITAKRLVHHWRIHSAQLYRQYTTNQWSPGGAGKKEMCDREATPSISLKITFQPQRPPWPDCPSVADVD